MKSLFRLLLFASLISLMGCTLTKRRYTSGYNLSWNSKLPDTKPIAPSQKPQTAQNKIAHSNKNSDEINIEPKTENANNNQKLVQAITSKPKEKVSVNSFSINSISLTYTVVPENTIPGSDITENDSSKRDVRLSWLFCLVGVLSGLLCGIVVLFSLFDSMGTIWNPSVTIIFLLPLIFLTLSTIYSLKALWGDKKLSVALYILLALCILIDILCSIIIVIETLELIFPHI